jgi:hypothetical protein
VPPGSRQQGREHRLVGRPAVVVGTPDPVRTHGQGVQHTEGEPAGPTQVPLAGQIGDRQPAPPDDVLGRVVRAVVDDHDMVHGPGLAGDRRQAQPQQLAPVPRDDDRDDPIAVRCHAGRPL